MNYTYTIPGRLPSLNDTIDDARGNRYKSANVKKALTEMCEWEVKRQKVPPMTVPIIVSILWVEKDWRRDPDNIVAGGRKPILDSLKNANIIANDNLRNIIGFVDNFEVNGTNPRVIVTLMEAE